MQQWSILSNVVNYVQYNNNPTDYNKFDVKDLGLKGCKGIYHKLEEDDRQDIDLNFHDMPKQLKAEYLDVYGGVKSDILYTTKFDKNSDSWTTPFGRKKMTR